MTPFAQPRICRIAGLGKRWELGRKELGRKELGRKELGPKSAQGA
jgi:hypothetical protein